MKLVGKTVNHIYGINALRFGIITEEKTENNWKYAKIKWFDDEGFEMDRQRVIDLRGYDKYSDWYRIDQLKLIDLDETIKTLNKLKNCSLLIDNLTKWANSDSKKKVKILTKQRAYFSRFSRKMPVC